MLAQKDAYIFAKEHYLKIKIRHACCAFYQSKTNFFSRKGLKTVSDVTSRALFIQLDVSQYSRNLAQPDLLQEGHERGSGKTSNMAFSLLKLW